MRLSRTHFVVGTRGSKLALEQANYVAALIKNTRKNLEVEVKVIKTSGDKIQDVALAKIGGKGLFTKELDKELLDYHIDVAVHSMKDVPAELDERLMIGSMPLREDVRDCVVMREGSRLDDLKEGARVGTGSLRRRAQLKRLRPDLELVNIRGNINTRLAKVLETKELDAVVLAAAGLNRLNLKDKISFYLNPEQMISAIGQGAIGIVCRTEDFYTQDIISEFSSKSTFNAVMAEREIMKKLEGGCQAPMGAFARELPTQPKMLRIDAFVSSLDGSKRIKLEHSDLAQNYEECGKHMADMLLDAGAQEILDAASKEYETQDDHVE